MTQPLNEHPPPALVAGAVTTELIGLVKTGQPHYKIYLGPWTML